MHLILSIETIYFFHPPAKVEDDLVNFSQTDFYATKKIILTSEKHGGAFLDFFCFAKSRTIVFTSRLATFTFSSLETKRRR